MRIPNRSQPVKQEKRTHPSGIFVVDKPAGMSSAKLVAVLKRALGVSKMGHTGTLDPFATGVMLCCVNKATKLSQYLMNSAKTYEAVLLLGVETDTQDATGQPVAFCEKIDVTEKALQMVLKRFVGDIKQVPPVYSALKHNGMPLYRLAREGNPVQKPARQVHISALEILKIDFPEVHIRVSCGAGTYIRTLGADIGKALGCGGHLKHLVRTESGGFNLSEAISVSTLTAQAEAGTAFETMIPMVTALHSMPGVVVNGDVVEKIRFGRLLTCKEVWGDAPIPEKTIIKVIDTDHCLLAILTLDKTGDCKYESVFLSDGH
jgi:tRNA pseudouridine55 synthase